MLDKKNDFVRENPVKKTLKQENALDHKTILPLCNVRCPNLKFPKLGIKTQKVS